MLMVFRTDASLEIGSGHVMRCLTLADALKAQGATCIFICRAHPGHLLDLVRERGYEAKALPALGQQAKGTGPSDAQQTMAVLANQKADWLVVDHYGLDWSWEIELKPHYKKLLVIDDLADRPHDCDVLLDQNLRHGAAARYRGLVPATCRLLLGPAHVLLAPAFDAALPRARVGELGSVLVYFGGNDRCNQAGRAVAALAHFPNIKVNVVLGNAHPFRDEVMAQARVHQQMRVRDTCSDMAGAMCQADFGLGTCGMAAWERCAVGLPSLVTVSADNQREDALALAALGAVQHLGDAAEVSVDAWIAAIGRFMADTKQAVHMAEVARAVVVGHTENRRRLVDLLVGRYAE